MRNLGAFFGGIWHGVRTDPSKPKRTEVKREVEEETKQTEGGEVTLRRTTIEEIEVHRPRNRS